MQEIKKNINIKLEYQYKKNRIHMLCPCHSLHPYDRCCRPFHDGKKKPQTALLLMRSRFSAYSLGLADYIINTTGKALFQKEDLFSWREQILDFSRSTEFLGLEIIEVQELSNNNAFVTFTAFLKQNGEKTTFTEKSTFERSPFGGWFYVHGSIL